MRNVCCISLNFPPSTIASVHRVRHLAKHLPSYGWRPTVVCVDERDLNEVLDWRLYDLVPADVLIHKVRAVPAELTGLVGITDLGLRAYWSLRQELKKLAKQENYDAVFITGWPFYQMLLSRFIKVLFGAPVVLDFQDPWVSTWGVAQPMLSKAGFTDYLGKLLEPRALRGADFITSVSDTQNAEMAARYPWLDTTRMAGIPIGGDPDDVSALPSAGAVDSIFGLDPGYVHLSYVGTCLPRAGGLLRTLFRAFARLRASDPALAAKIRFNFVGTSNQSYDRTARVRPIAEAEGVADAVREEPRRLPYLDALGILARSNGILLIGSDEPHYTASKIYPALMSGRPFLSLFHRVSSAHAILSGARGGRAFAFGSPDELAQLEGPIAEALATMAAAPDTLGTVDPNVYAPYEAHSIAGRFASIFDSLAVARAT